MLYKIQSIEEFLGIRTYLLVAFIIVLLAGSGVFYIRSHKTTNIPTRRLCTGYSLFGLTYAITRFFFLLSDYEIGSHEGVITHLHLIWVLSAYCVTFLSLIFMFHTFEKIILSRKAIFTAISFMNLALCLVALILTIFGVGVYLPTDVGTPKIPQLVFFVTGPIICLGIASLYLIIIKNSTGIIRRRAIISTFGLACFFIGLVLDLDALSILGINAIRYVLAPTLLTIGAIIFFATRMDDTLVQYYQTKRICIVCRGSIKGKIFICGKCAIFYCIACKEALAAAENKCWNCSEPLESGREVTEDQLPTSSNNNRGLEETEKEAKLKCKKIA